VDTRQVYLVMEFSKLNWTFRYLEAEKLYGTRSEEHPAVRYLIQERGRYYLGGKIFGIRMPSRSWVHCKTPLELRKQYKEYENLIAFHCRTPMQRTHVAMLKEVATVFLCIIHIQSIHIVVTAIPTIQNSSSCHRGSNYIKG
jgi:ATP sulfurylase